MTSIPPASEPLEPVPAQSVVGEGSTSPAHELLEFNVEVTEAAELLGVSRTRLSQLTSKGIFSFERRKIDSRNRLFYSKHELLQYLKGQRGRISGATSAGAQFQWSPSASPMAAQIHSQNISHNESEKNPQASLFSSEDVQNLFLQAQEVQALKTQFQISRQASLQKAQRNPLLNLHSALELSRQDTALENWNGLQKSLSELQQQQLDLSADIAKQWNEFLELKKNLRQATQETAKNRGCTGCKFTFEFRFSSANSTWN